MKFKYGMADNQDDKLLDVLHYLGGERDKTKHLKLKIRQSYYNILDRIMEPKYIESVSKRVDYVVNT